VQEFSITVPRYFNFGYDIIDTWAEKDRNKLAMIWVSQEGCEKKFSFRDLKNLSNQAANILIKYGIQRGDKVLLILPRIPEWWVFMIALIKLGAVICPCPTMLTPKDIRYRLNAEKFRMVITCLEHAGKVDEIAEECPSLSCRFLVDGERPGWISYPLELHYPAPVSHHSVSIPGEKKTLSTDPMLIYFTSGTTGEPKMVLHDHSYPLGHLVTAGLWHDLTQNDVHFTYSDTGWAKCAWGKIFGQWILGACVFVYDARGKFKATELLPLMEKYEITTFCVPPTIYRMLILADLEKFDLRELRHCVSAGEPLNPEANAESFVNGFYYTGDKACMDDDGYFWFVGRDDDIIKSAGYRIGPFEVESALIEHPAVAESAVVGSPDLIRGTIVKAFIVLKPGFEPSEKLVRDIQAFVRKNTAPYKYPRAIEFVAELPKTLSGKIKRGELRQMELERFANRA